MRIIKYFFLGFVTISALTSSGIYYGEMCKKESGVVQYKSKKCKITRLSSLSGQIFLNGARSTFQIVDKFIKTGSIINSGRIVKRPKETMYRFQNLKQGFNFYYEPNTKPNAGYLLLSVSDPKNNGKPLIEIWDLNKQKLLHKYSFNINDIRKKSRVKIGEDRNIVFKQNRL